MQGFLNMMTYLTSYNPCYSKRLTCHKSSQSPSPRSPQSQIHYTCFSFVGWCCNHPQAPIYNHNLLHGIIKYVSQNI